MGLWEMVAIISVAGIVGEVLKAYMKRNVSRQEMEEIRNGLTSLQSDMDEVKTNLANIVIQLDDIRHQP